MQLTHWGRMTHIWVSKITIIGSDNGLSPCQHQAIIWTNAGILLIGSLRTIFSENFNRNSNIFIKENAFENVIWKMATVLSRLSVLISHAIKGTLVAVTADAWSEIVIHIWLRGMGICVMIINDHVRNATKIRKVLLRHVEFNYIL